GRDQVVGGQLANSSEILAAGPVNQPGKLHVADQAISEFGHRDTSRSVRVKEFQPQRLEPQRYHTRIARCPASSRPEKPDRSPIPRRSRFVQTCLPESRAASVTGQ